MLSSITSNFIVNGFVDVSSIVKFDHDSLRRIYLQILKSRNFDNSTFIDQPDDLSHLQYKGVNPRPDENNFLLDLNTSFIENNIDLDEILQSILGNYRIILKKIICGLPDNSIPNWVIELVKDKPVPNLGTYIKTHYQDITYFRGIDWHQDIIDYPGKDPRFHYTIYLIA